MSQSFVANNLQMGTTYRFKVAARNSVGYSELSESVSVLAAEVPSQPAAPTTTLVGANVYIDWTAPSNGGSPITMYHIRIQKADGTYRQDLTHCDGTTEAIASVL